MTNRFAWPALLLAGLALSSASRISAAEDFERPADQPPSASLSGAQVSGPNFHVEDPVHSDGLMHRYVIDSHFGVFNAYGIDALNTRLREVAALTTLEKTSDGQVVVESVVRGLREQTRSMVRVATHPVGTVLGIPTGVAHLLGGYRAEAQEVTAGIGHALTPGGASQSKNSSGYSLQRVGTEAGHAAQDQAEHYAGLPDAERRWYAKLGVDPYTDNIVLRRAVTRMARIDAAASFGMRFAPVGIPFSGEVERALNTIDHENPAVLRKRRREALLRAGLTSEEVTRFEHTPLLTPTRQTVLVNALGSLDGVGGRVELLRHAMTVQSEDETEVFLQSTLLLLRYHAHHPIKRILAGVRIPAAALPDGRVAVFGAFDAVEWTQEVAGYEHDLRQALPPGPGREIWITGSVSPRARAALEGHGWVVHASAAAARRTAAARSAATESERFLAAATICGRASSGRPQSKGGMGAYSMPSCTACA
jgi:hypothetical protein